MTGQYSRLGENVTTPSALLWWPAAGLRDDRAIVDVLTVPTPFAPAHDGRGRAAGGAVVSPPTPSGRVAVVPPPPACGFSLVAGSPAVLQTTLLA